MVIALPNGNADDEPQRHGKWSGRRLPVETSIDKSDAEPSQTGVKEIFICCDDIDVGAQPISFIVAQKKIKKWGCEVVVAYLCRNT